MWTDARGWPVLDPPLAWVRAVDSEVHHVGRLGQRLVRCGSLVSQQLTDQRGDRSRLCGRCLRYARIEAPLAKVAPDGLNAVIRRYQASQGIF